MEHYGWNTMVDIARSGEVVVWAFHEFPISNTAEGFGSDKQLSIHNHKDFLILKGSDSHKMPLKFCSKK